jgi:predicted phosphodiesterase
MESMSIPRKAALLAAFALPIALADSTHAAAARGPILKGPYLHALASDRVEVRFELDHAAAAVLEVAPEGAEAQAKRIESKAADFHAVMVTGLDAQKRYKYTVRVAGADASAAPVGSFTTAPKDDATQSFSFMVYGDNRTDAAAHAALVRAMKKEPSDFLVHTGDFVGDGSSAEDWQQFFDIESELLRDRCLFACVGNHELFDKVGTSFLRYIGPGAQIGEDKPKLYGSVRWQNTRFFFLNFMTDDRAAEKAWLEEELTKSDKEPGIVWRVAVMHHGLWSSGPHGKNKRMHEAQIPALLRKHDVDLVLSGHDHIYERGYAEGTRYLVSGGGGAPVYEINATAGSRKSEATRHYVLVTMSPTSAKIAAKRADGSTLDLCGFDKAQSDWECDRNTAAVSAASTAPPATTTATTPPASRCSCRAVGAPAPRGLAALIAALGAAFAARRRPRARL